MIAVSSDEMNSTQYLTDLSEKLERNQRAHYRSCERCERMNWILGVITVIASVAAAALFQAPIDAQWYDYTTIGLPMVAATTSGIQTLSRYDLRAAQHQAAAVDYGALLRHVLARISGSYSEIENRDEIEVIRQEYHRISKYAPLTYYNNRIVAQAMAADRASTE